MKFFLDTGDVQEVQEAMSWGLLDGVTTNPSHIAKTGRGFLEVLREIVDIVPGPVSAEVTATDYAGMMRQAHTLTEIAPNIVIKVPLIVEGLKAVRQLTEEGIRTNVTLCFSPVQALLAAKAGATYVSPFIGRLDDIGQEGMDGIVQIRRIFDNYNFATQILTASTRGPLHIRDAALAGSDVVTMPFDVFAKLPLHPLTDIGLEKFLNDWNKIPEELRGV